MIARSSKGVVDMNLYPGFGDNAAFYSLVANALGGGKLALLASDGTAGAKAALLATGKFTTIDEFSALGALPSLATLSAYDAVLAWTNFVPSDATGMGNLLADYFDLGGKRLVVSTYSFSTPWAIAGRVVTDGYAGLINLGVNGDVSGSLSATVPGDPIFSGITLGSITYFHNINFAHPGLAAGATLLATDGAAGPAGCAEHTVHGHVSTSPPGHFAHIAVEGIHHGQHGHTFAPGSECLPAGHHVTVNGHILGLTPESADGAIPSALTPEPDFVAALNQDGLNGPAAAGTIVQLFGSANGLFLDLADLRPALEFTPSASGSPLYYTEAMPEVQIGGVKAEVLFSGLAPGLKGVWQINVRIPDGTQSGKVLVTIAYEGDGLRSIDLSVE